MTLEERIALGEDSALELKAVFIPGRLLKRIGSDKTGHWQTFFPPY